MADNVIAKYQIEGELYELHRRISKLEEMKNGRGWNEQIHGTEDEFLQSQCSQFFLGL